MKKLRPDSTFSRISATQLAEIDDLLLSGAGYKEVQHLLADAGQKCSLTSIADYYQTHVAPRKWARQQRVASELAKLESEGVDDATLLAVRQATLELALTPGGDAKTLRMLYDLVLKAQAQQLESRRIELLEAKARKAEETEQDVNTPELSDDEILARVKQRFGMR